MSPAPPADDDSGSLAGETDRSSRGPTARPRAVRVGLMTLYLVAALLGLRALWLVPRQLDELRSIGAATAQRPLPIDGELPLRVRAVQPWVGVPLAGVAVQVVRVPAGEPVGEGGRWTRSEPRVLESDGAGWVEARVRAGLYELQVAGDEHNAARSAQVLVSPAGQLPSPALLAAHPVCELTVTLVDGGAPVVGAELFLKNGDPGRAFFTPQPMGLATTGVDGTARCPCRCGDILLREVTLPGEPRRFVERAVSVTASEAAIRLDADEIRAGGTQPAESSLSRLGPGEHARWVAEIPAEPAAHSGDVGAVELSLVDSAGQPAMGRVLFDPLDQGMQAAYPDRRFLPGWPTVQPDGSLRVEAVPTGRYQLLVLPVGAAPWVGEPFEVATGETTSLGRWTVPRRAAVTVSGTVMADGEPVGGAEVYLLGTAALGRLHYSFMFAHLFPRTISDADGRFELAGLPPEDVVLGAYHRAIGESDPRVVSLAAGAAAVDGGVVSLETGTRDVRMGWIDGAKLDLGRDAPVFVGVVSGTRAARAGIEIGDRLLAIDGRDVRWLGRHRLYALLAGDDGRSPAELTLARDGVEGTFVVAWGGGPEVEGSYQEGS